MATDDFPSGRRAAGAQATLTISGGGTPVNGPGTTGTTAGTDPGVQDGVTETAGPRFGLDGQSYTVTQSGLPNPTLYRTTYECRDRNTNSVLTSGTGSVATFTMPPAAGPNGTAAYCLFTNTPLSAKVTLDKRITPNTTPGSTPNSTISYQFVVTNTGNVALDSVSVTDTKLTNPGVTCPAGSLAPGESRICTGTYTITQADADAGSVVNTATASGQPSVAGLTAPTASDTNTAPITRTPAIRVVKTATPNRGSDNRLNAGDTIGYTFDVTNTGNVTLSGVAVTDAKIPSITCSPTTLAAGATVRCTSTATYTVLQSDVNAGQVSNTATASGNAAGGGTVTNAATVNTPTSDLKTVFFDKTAAGPVDTNNDGITGNAGDRITYSFLVRNTGDRTLNGLAISDALVPGITCSPASLAPRAEVTCTGPAYTITQADVNAGAVTNNATLTTDATNGPRLSETDTTTTATNTTAALSLTKSASQPTTAAGVAGRVDAGDTITYTFTVRNTGAQTLSAVQITDDKLGAVTCPAGEINRNGGPITCTATYTIGVGDVNSGGVTNTATATAARPGGTRVSSAPASVTTPITQVRTIAIDKEIAGYADLNNNSRADTGDRLDYTFVVTNTGSVTLTDASVTDGKVGAVTCPTGAGSLAPGASVICTASYLITQSDVNTGAVNNSATASGQPPTGQRVTSPADTTSRPTSDVSTISVTKSAAPYVDVNNSRRLDAGDTIAYSFLVTNTGARTLTDVRVTDNKVGAVTCPGTANGVGPTLNGGATLTCTVTYTVTQPDVDAGQIVNTANASGVNPGGTRIGSAPSSVTTTIAPTGALTLAKTIATRTAGNDVNNNNRVDVGDTVVYNFRLTNTGSVTLSTLAVSDNRIGAVTCPTISIAPGESATCSKTYTLAQADIDAGPTLVNTATASARTPANAPVQSAPSQATQPLDQTATLLLNKTASAVTEANNTPGTNPGDAITYTFAITNTGSVTLNRLAVVDPRIGEVTCAVTSLGQGASTTCTKTYALTQGDINDGAVTNANATVTGRTPGDPGTLVTSNPDTTTTPVTTASTLTLTKSAGTVVQGNLAGSRTDRVDAGDTIPYTFTVQNTGNTTVASLLVRDSKIAGDITDCVTRTLAPGATTTCSASYVITQPDVDTGQVRNLATARGQSRGAEVVSPQAQATVATSTVNALFLDKNAGGVNDTNNNTRVDVGDTITYSFLVRNDGAQTLRTIGINDNRVSTASCPTGPLAPGQSLTCSLTYTLVQGDIDAGSVNNSATATGTPPNAAAITSNTDTTSTPVNRTGALTIVKSRTSITDTAALGRVDRGDVINYNFRVTNTGNVTYSTITVTDPKVGAVTCPAGSLAPGGVRDCTASYTITQDDVDAGSVVNTASVRGTPVTGDPVDATSNTVTTRTSDFSTVTIDKQAAAPVDANGDGITDAGDTIAYSFRVTNTGDQSLSNVRINDPSVTATCPGGSGTTGPTLAAGASVTCTATYTIRQADVNNGAVNNTATAVGTRPRNLGDTTSAADTTTTPTSVATSLTVDKTAAAPTEVDGTSAGIGVGDTIAYTFRVQNTGAQDLTGVRIVDSKLPEPNAPACDVTALAPRAITTCRGTYTITQADVNAGAVNNEATARGTTPRSAEISSQPDRTTTLIATNSALTLTKTAGTPSNTDGDNRVDVDDTIVYTFTATNQGTVTLDNLTVTDPKVAVSCTVTTLAPRASTTCTSAPYPITQAEVDRGRVDNTARARATDPGANPVLSDVASAEVTIAPVGTIDLVKTAGAPTETSGNNRIGAGDTITYSFRVTNTGTVTMSQVRIDDPLVGEVVCQQTLVPGESVLCTAPYVIQQSDVNAGAVTNRALVRGTTPAGVRTPSAVRETSTPLTGLASLALTKTAGGYNDANSDGRIDAGDTLAYTFRVTNNGDVTVGGLTINDAKVTGTRCAASSVEPGQSVNCSAAYTITQADTDAGAVVNFATVTGTSPRGAVVTSPTAREDYATSRVATLELVKSVTGVTDVDNNQRTTRGDLIGYRFEVRNTGAVTVRNLVIDDARVASSTCDVTTLAPGGRAVCTATYEITQTDVNSGLVRNTATARGVDPRNAPVVSDPSSTDTPTSQNAALRINKTATVQDVDGQAGTGVGDRIRYAFVITNTGDVSVNGVAVNDVRTQGATCQGSTNLAAGQSVTCRRDYTITQGDVDAGGVTNTATATGTTPAPGNVAVTSPSDTTTTPTTSTSALQIVKSAGTPSNTDSDNRVDAGDTIPYTFTVTNTGTVTLTDVRVQDSLTGESACVATLAPNESATCDDASYVVTQPDVDRGRVVNTAYATAIGRGGAPVRSLDDEETTPTSAAATLTLDKGAATPVDVNGNSRVDAGDTIGYTFTVANTGAVTLDNVAISDPKAGAVTCPGGSLAPSDPARVCSTTYTITQADVNAGAVRNVATATATSVRGGNAVPARDETTTATTSVPEIDIVLTGVAADVDANGRIEARDTIVYTYTVTNTGTLPLSAVTVTDDLGNDVDCEADTLSPGESFECTSTYPLDQDDIDAGQVLNEADVVGTPPGNRPAVRDSDPETTPLTGRAAVSIVTTAPGGVTNANANPRQDAGDVIDYVYRVTNTGTVSLSAITVTPTRGGAVTCEVTELLPGASTLCRNRYVLTQDDVDAGTVTNLGRVDASSRNLGPVTDSEPETTPITAPGAISVTIDDNAGVVESDTPADGDSAGDTIDYTYVVTNTGPVTLTGVVLVDDLGTTITCDPATPLTLVPNQSVTCTSTFTLDQPDVDAGAVDNAVTATGTPPRGADVTATDDITTPVDPAGDISIELSADDLIDLDGNGPDVGDALPYNYRVTNTGTSTLDTVLVTDRLGTAITCPTDTLAPGDVTVCTGRHLLTQAEVNRGSVVNEATTQGLTPTDDLVDDTDDLTTPVTTRPAAIDLTLTQAGAPDSAGDPVTYTYRVQNTGPVTLTGVTVTDTLGNTITCDPTTPTTLAPGAITRCTSTYPVTQPDVDAGSVNNRATTTGTPPTGPAVSDTEVVATPITASGLIQIVLTAPDPIRDLDGNGPDAGDALDYVYTVTNTGTSTLSAVGVTDSLGTTISCPAATLEPNRTLVCRGTHTLTQPEVDARQVVNVATTTGLTPAGVTVTDDDTLPRTITPRAGQVEITLTAAGGVADLDGNGPDRGDTITYSYVVRNVGPVSLTDVRVTDTLGNTVVCDTTVVLAPGESTTCDQASYTLTNADANRGAVTNTATVLAEDLSAGGDVTDTDVVTTSATGRGLIDIVLDGLATDTTGNGAIDAGDTVVYRYRVTNIGTVTLSGITVTDSVGTQGISCPATTLDPGESFECTGRFPISQGAVDRGRIDNVATASGAVPGSGQRVRDTDPEETVLVGRDTLSVTGVSTIDDVDNNGQDAGDTISYLYTVTNNGTTTVTGPQVVDAFGNTVLCTPTSLAPGASATCTSPAAYTLTQADVNAGTVPNSVTASATTATSRPVTATGSVPTTVAAGGAVTIELTTPNGVGGIRDLDGNGPDAGDAVDYSYLVTNTGSVDLSTVTVTDSLGNQITCRAATLVPGGTTTCTSTYLLTQTDVDAGGVTNTATVTGRTPAGAQVDDTDDVETTVTPRAGGLTVTGEGTVNDLDGNGQDVGDSVDFVYTVTNNSAVTVTNPTVTDRFGNTVVCTPTSLAPGTSATCTLATPYTLTQADLNAGVVDNPLTATGSTPGGGTTTGTGDADVTLAPGGAVTIELTTPSGVGGIRDLDGNGPDAGDAVDYSYLVTNTGSVDLSTVTVTDSLGNQITCRAATLVPGGTTTCTSTYLLTQGDVDAGAVTNTATVTGRTPAGAQVDDTDPAVTAVVADPPGGLVVDVTAGPIVDVDRNGTDVGDTITYTYVATNNGTSTLSAVEVTSSLPEALTCQPVTPTRLAPGESVRCTSTHVITGAELTAGQVVNDADATGTTPGGTPVAAPGDTETTPLPTPGSLLVDVSGGPIRDLGTPGVDAGDEIDYTYVVTNNGPTTLTDVTVGSSLPEGVVCPTGPLAPGASVTCTSTHVITGADLTAGSVINDATATGTTPGGATVTSPEDSAATPLPTGGGLTLDVTAGPVVDAGTPGPGAGDTITYTYTLTNSGQTPVDGIDVTSSLGDAVTCTPVTPTTLAAGATLTCTSTHVVTQDEITAGTVTNTGTATGTANGTPVPAAEDTETTPLPTPGSLVVDVTSGAVVDGDGNGPDAGDTVEYTYTVTNNGPTTLTGVTVDSTLPEGVVCPAGPLAPGDSITCTSTHVVTDAEVTAGRVVNEATASGTTPSGATVTSADDSTSTPIVPRPVEAGALSLDKQAATPVDVNANGRVDAGDTIAYTFTVANTGNVALRGVTVQDAKVGAVSCPAGALAVGDSVTCTASYTITAADVTAGGVTNTATASGTTPGNDTVTTRSDTVVTPTTPVVPPPGQGALTLDKQAATPVDVNTNGRVDAGDTIAYTFVVTNTGNVPLSGVAVNDSKVAVTCPPGNLAPNSSRTCNATYTITAADVTAGGVTNTATATGTTPAGTTVTSGQDTVITPTTPVTPPPGSSSLTIDKQASAPVDVNTNGRVDAGDTIAYTFVVTNTGTTTLTSVGVNDSKVGAVNCNAVALPAGGSTTCTASYTITAADVVAGGVVNVATASGTPPLGDPITSPTDTVTTPTTPVVTPISSASIDKQAAGPEDVNGNGAVDVGDTIDYTFVVTNTGNTPLTGVTVLDALVDVTCPATTLAVGGTLTCTGSYTITDADLAAGGVINTATLTAVAPGGETIEDEPTDTVVSPIGPDGASLELDKKIRRVIDVDDSGTTNLGDAIVYAFTVTNTGEVELSEVAVGDPMLTEAGVDITCPGTVLAPGESFTCVSGRYLIDADDVAKGSVDNQGTVTAVTPDGQLIDGEGDGVTLPGIVGDDGDGPDQPGTDPGAGGDTGPISDPKLPGTGTTVEPWMPIGAALVLLGGLSLLISSRRRRREQG